MSNQYRGRAYYRMMARRKSWHKRRICRHVYGWEYYDNLHEYSKGKIHCSCPMCRAGAFDAGKNTSNMRQYSMSTQRRYAAVVAAFHDFLEENI